MNSILKGIGNSKSGDKTRGVRKQELLILMAIVGLGVIGSCYCFSSSCSKASYNEHNVVNTTKKNRNVMAGNEDIQINGEFIAGNSLQFNADNLSYVNPLYIDYGNGEIHRIYDKKKAEYNYSIPGFYDVKVFTVKDKRKEVLSNQSIQIQENYRYLSELE